jgi:hypothetical protein
MDAVVNPELFAWNISRINLPTWISSPRGIRNFTGPNVRFWPAQQTPVRSAAKDHNPPLVSTDTIGP